MYEETSNDSFDFCSSESEDSNYEEEYDFSDYEQEERIFDQEYIDNLVLIDDIEDWNWLKAECDNHPYKHFYLIAIMIVQSFSYFRAFYHLEFLMHDCLYV